MSNEQAKILVVDDETHLADGIRENLEAEGYLAAAAYDGQVGLDAALSGEFDLVILDVMMPHLDGIAVCKQMREQGNETPVLFLTVKAAPEERIEGLAAGADDYLGKPFHLEELLLRVAAILKRHTGSSRPKAKVLEFGNNRIDFESYRATAWDESIHELTHKEAMILYVLNESLDKIVTREEILERVWDQEVYPSTRTIDNFIVRLRKRFENNPEIPAHIHTVRGMGYRLSLQPENEESSTGS